MVIPADRPIVRAGESAQALILGEHALASETLDV
jgi:hypothetical protein